MAWLITEDLLIDHLRDDTDGTEVAVAGPSNGSDSEIAALKAGDGFEFRLRDDDGVVYYHGLSSEIDSFDPLDEFGTPHAGCVDIQYHARLGGWESLGD